MNDQTQAPAPNAAPETPPQHVYAPCPCGQVPESLLIEVAQDNKVARAAGNCCATWYVEFLRGNTVDQQVITDRATKAWDAAPRSTTP